MSLDDALLLRTARFDVVQRNYPLPDGGSAAREVVLHPGAVAVLPLLGEDRLLLIRNYRAAVGETLIELPAGTLEPGEDPVVCAARELEEETGYRAGRLVSLMTMWMSPGILRERMHVFVAHELVAMTARPEPGELIEPLVVPFAQAMELVQRGEIRDAKSVAALLYWERFTRRS